MGEQVSGWGRHLLWILRLAIQVAPTRNFLSVSFTLFLDEFALMSFLFVAHTDNDHEQNK